LRRGESDPPRAARRAMHHALMRRPARSPAAWCVAAVLAAASAASPCLGAGKGDMIEKSTLMLEDILKSVEAGDVLEPGPLVYLQAEADRENPMAMYILGWYRLKRNQWEQGLSLLEKSANKDYIRAQLVLAQTALSHKDFPGARNWIDRARANRESGDFPHHIARLEEAVRLESDATDKALATSRLVDLSRKALNAMTPPQSERTASDCAEDLSSISDSDIARNAALIRKAGLCYREEKLADAGLKWKLSIIENRAQPQGPRIAIPRDNEGSAFDVAVYAVATYGGRMVAVETGDQKGKARAQDPNRAFGTGKSCAGLKHPAPRYTERLIGLLKGGRHWFSLHNNDGGLSAATTSGQMTGFVNAAATGALADPHNVVVFAGSELVTEPGPIGWRNRLQSLGMNVIYEQVDASTNDCSLSNYLVLHRLASIGKYFNIMVGANDHRTQKKMVDLLFGSLGYRKTAVTASKTKP
jgi:hypothetical protein